MASGRMAGRKRERETGSRPDRRRHCQSRRFHFSGRAADRLQARFGNKAIARPLQSQGMEPNCGQDPRRAGAAG